MHPEDNRSATPTIVPPARPGGLLVDGRDNGQDAAANVVRGQIDTLYDQHALTQQVESPDTSDAGQSVQSSGGQVNLQVAHQPAEAANPYERTHDEATHQIEATSWQRYHSAWQSYYQQYYERYYVGQVHAAKQSLEEQFTHKPEGTDPISTDEALYDLRSKLRSQITTRATKIRKSRHFVPAIAASMVMLLFLFLQYNRILFANVEAYVSPGSLSQSSIIVDANSQTAVGPEQKLIIPSISIEVPIVWDAVASDQNSLNSAMDKGVAWFNIAGASAHPGELGNFALSGHSSNDWMDKGDYKFIFARLEQLKEGDTIYVNYNSTRYTYTVTSSKVVKPTEVSALQVGTDKPRITLITCTPIGTDWNRLLVFADQVSPDPKAAASSTTTSTNNAGATKMPSNSPTFFQRLFGIGGS